MLNTKAIGVKVPEILLPAKDVDFSKWAVVACDQYTAQREYWEEAEKIIGGCPSALRLILPEAYLGDQSEAARIEGAKRSMKEYLDNGTLRKLKKGFIFVKRNVGGKQRLGLVIALDLEHYDYNKGASTLIRATEGTIVDRIPPRLRIRSGAMLELPHILVLIDDPDKTVIEPLANEELTKLYDTELMLGGGRLEGYAVNEPELIEQIINALAILKDEDAFAKKYGKEQAPLLFAMGDGNHSFATAKAAWENIKATLSEQEKEAHPARYALVEIENVHDDGIVFEPIHRVLFKVDPEEAINKLEMLLKDGSSTVKIIRASSENTSDRPWEDISSEGTHVLPFLFNGCRGAFLVDSPSQQLPVGTLQNALDKLGMGEIDYIHGDDVVSELSKGENTIGFLLSAMKKSELFKTVVYDGALPRKTFSMGEANEKRYYMECRRIVP